MTDAIDDIRARLAGASKPWGELTVEPGGPGSEPIWDVLTHGADAILVANAPQDLAHLLERVDQLTADKAALVREYWAAKHGYDDARADLRKLTDARQALADALEWQVDSRHGEICDPTLAWRDCADTDGHERERHALAAWAAVNPLPPPTGAADQ